jgi:hypothetical protein
MRLALRLACVSLAGLAIALLPAGCGGQTQGGGPGGDAEAGVGQETGIALEASTMLDTSTGSEAASEAGEGQVESGAADAHAPDAAPTPPPPDHHRPDDSQCRAPRAAGLCSMGPSSFSCSSDTQCADGGVNGRCTNVGPLPGCFCSYDQCQADSDCGAGMLCVCHESAYVYGGGNVCMPGNCRIDADCGPGGFCSPAHGTGGNCGGVNGYFCHTDRDMCRNDSDCSGFLPVCTWLAMYRLWDCRQPVLCQ